MSEEEGYLVDDLIDGLQHVRDDHKCCKVLLDSAILGIEDYKDIIEDLLDFADVKDNPRYENSWREAVVRANKAIGRG